MQALEKQKAAPTAIDTTRDNESRYDPDSVQTLAPHNLMHTESFHTAVRRQLVFTRLAARGERSRPATMRDVVVDRGEFVGTGVPRTAGGYRYEPLDWPKGLVRV